MFGEVDKLSPAKQLDEVASGGAGLEQRLGRCVMAGRFEPANDEETAQRSLPCIGEELHRINAFPRINAFLVVDLLIQHERFIDGYSE